MKALSKIFALSAFLSFACIFADAQQVYTKWNDIDNITIYKVVNTADCGTLYILPADETVCEFKDESQKVNDKVATQMAAFRPMIQKMLKKHCPKLAVELVDAEPANLNANDLVMKIKYVSYDLGSRAARVWGSFGAGHATIRMIISLSDGNGEKVYEMDQQHLAGANPFKDARYDKVLADMHGDFADDIAVVFKAMNKMK